MRYADVDPTGCDRWCFAAHPQVPILALTMKQRYELPSLTKIYTQHNPALTNLTVEELRSNIEELSSL